MVTSIHLTLCTAFAVDCWGTSERQGHRWMFPKILLLFAGFQRTLNSEMKRLHALGLAVKKQAETNHHWRREDLLWETGFFLGDTNPQQLLDTVLFLCGVHFALRSGEEHRSLQLSQLELVCPKDGRSHLIYTENYSNNNQGGLLHCKVKPKGVRNESNLNWCLVHYFQTYLKHRPVDCSTFYLTPLRKIKGDIWYSKMPVGHNTVRSCCSCMQTRRHSRLQN